MLRVGLTGGIGSGKSTVAKMFEGLGAGVIDADAISRSATARNGPAVAAIAAQFGPEFITADNAMDRDRMRALVFEDASAKKRLEAIIHPLVGQQIHAQASAMHSSGKLCVFFDIPLLVESGHWRKQLDRVLVVDCSVATQMARVMDRNGMRAPEIEQIIASQASRQQRLCAADLALFNDGISLNTLAGEVREIAAHFGL